jgi:hypothetical protein
VTPTEAGRVKHQVGGISRVPGRHRQGAAGGRASPVGGAVWVATPRTINSSAPEPNPTGIGAANSLPALQAGL